MNPTQYNQFFSFIWNIATDVFVYAFEKGDHHADDGAASH